MITQLVLKDLYFLRWPMLGYLATGLIGSVLLTVSSPIMYYIGLILLISSIVVIGAHLVFGSVMQERSKQTLPFILSLPVSFAQYSRAKLFGSIGIFLALWVLILGATIVAVLSKESVPNGFIPYATILLVELFAAFVLTLAIEIVLESEAWTIVVTTLCNIGISIFAFSIGQIPEIAAHIQGAAPVWNGTALSILGIELLFVLGVISATLYLQSRKTDFI